VAVGLGLLAAMLRTFFWSLVVLFATAAVVSRLLLEIRRARGHADAVGRVRPGGLEGFLAGLAPWVAFLLVAYRSYLTPLLVDERPAIGPFGLTLLALAIAVTQAGRRTARLLSAGEIRERLDEGRLRRTRTLWRRLARRVFGLDLPREEVRALAGVSFRVERGMIGILGPNGAGKTTLLRQLAGILEPTRGRIHLGGVHLGKLRKYLARWVGYLPQDTSLPPALTAREYLEYFALLYEIPAAERDDRVAKLLAEVGLGERADEKIGGYSGGMRQRVAVARTLLRLPPVIIVDEPTVGLDPRERIRFRNLLSRLAAGRVVLFSTHVVEDVAVACERVIVLARGRLAFDGPPAKLTEAARGQVWEATLPQSELAGLPAAAKISDQVPVGEGRSRLRIISRERPHPEARAAEPTLEEGYLMLVGGRSL
jgi:ABC-type multidrug transport system ATPase subunit